MLSPKKIQATVSPVQEKKSLFEPALFVGKIAGLDR